MLKLSVKRVLTIGLSVALALIGTLAAPAAANAPVAIPLSEVFVDVNPCTGLDQTITVTGTLYVHDNDGALVVTADRTITTSAGFEGRGTSTFVNNGEVSRFSLRDMLVSDSGARIRAGFILVLDLATGEVKAFPGAVTCVQP